MFRKPLVLKDYNRMAPLQQVSFGRNVKNALAANPTVFNALPVNTTDLATACTNLETAYNDYHFYGESHKGAFLEAQAIWKEKYNLTADYVELVANETPASALSIINLSQFHVSKTETDPTQKAGVPENVEIISGRVKGSVDVSVDAVKGKGSKAYIFGVATPDFEFNVTENQITIKLGDSFVSLLISTKSKAQFKNLPSRLDAEAAACIFNAAGLGEFTSGITVTIP